MSNTFVFFDYPKLISNRSRITTRLPVVGQNTDSWTQDSVVGLEDKPKYLDE